jgi:hypothetical protein
MKQGNVNLWYLQRSFCSFSLLGGQELCTTSLAIAKLQEKTCIEKLQKIFFVSLCGEGRDSKGLSYCGKPSGIEAFNLDDI